MLDQINKRLKAGGIKVTVQQRNDSLYLVATLPPKPGSGKSRPHQQRIPIGVKAAGDGFKKAELEARRLGLRLFEGSFCWDTPKQQMPAKEVIDFFAATYFKEHGRTPKTETSYSKHAHAFNRLPGDQVITEGALIAVIETQAPNTRGRQMFANSMRMLGKVVGIDLDISSLKGNYSLKRVNPRSLPTDLEIQQAIDKFSYDPYRWVYGMMATYGLRNHEVFLVDHELLINEGICYVGAGNKTYDGKAWAFFPEWVELFDLKNVRLPLITGKNNSERGQRIARGFKRAEIGFTPYALRHCWARRSIEMGLDSRLAAKQMRHSHSVHVKVYNAWLDDSVHQRAYDRIMDNPDRLQPPE